MDSELQILILRFLTLDESLNESVGDFRKNPRRHLTESLEDFQKEIRAGFLEGIHGAFSKRINIIYRRFFSEKKNMKEFLEESYGNFLNDSLIEFLD